MSKIIHVEEISSPRWTLSDFPPVARCAAFFAIHNLAAIYLPCLNYTPFGTCYKYNNYILSRSAPNDICFLSRAARISRASKWLSECCWPTAAEHLRAYERWSTIWDFNFSIMRNTLQCCSALNDKVSRKEKTCPCKKVARRVEIFIYKFRIITINDCLLWKYKSACVTPSKVHKDLLFLAGWFGNFLPFRGSLWVARLFLSLEEASRKKARQWNGCLWFNKRWLFCMPCCLLPAAARASIIHLSTFFFAFFFSPVFQVHTNTNAVGCFSIKNLCSLLNARATEFHIKEPKVKYCKIQLLASPWNLRSQKGERYLIFLIPSFHDSLRNPFS